MQSGRLLVARGRGGLARKLNEWDPHNLNLHFGGHGGVLGIPQDSEALWPPFFLLVT